VKRRKEKEKEKKKKREERRGRNLFATTRNCVSLCSPHLPISENSALQTY
jgi:hypothetical protein